MGKFGLKFIMRTLGVTLPDGVVGRRQCQRHCNYNEFPQRIVRYSSWLLIFFNSVTKNSDSCFLSIFSVGSRWESMFSSKPSYIHIKIRTTCMAYTSIRQFQRYKKTKYLQLISAYTSMYKNALYLQYCTKFFK